MSEELTSLRRDVGGRRRRAPRAEETSDVRRFRGALTAALVAGAGALVAAFALLGSGVRSPGPLSRPHAAAGLACGACHEAASPAAACTGCHGDHRSTRDAHRALVADGRLACPTCHEVHRHESGVTFAPDGVVVRWGPGAERIVDGAVTAFRPTTPVTVPLLRARACETCHDLSRPDDPAAPCALGGTTHLGADRPMVCFDEHRRVSRDGVPDGVGARGRTASRDAAWEAARNVAAAVPAAPSAWALSSVAWVGVGAALGAVALVVRRRRRGPGERPATTASAAVTKRLPVVDPNTCLGCYACVDACPFDVLTIERYVAVVARPDDCCGLTLCEQRCPNGSLVVVTEHERAPDRPRVSATLEAEAVPGVYLAGDLTGVPLIRNAIHQGSTAVAAIAEQLASEDPNRRPGVVDVAIVGAGPAGISAALEAKSKGLSARVFEQGSVAESIRSFPRGKLVFDQPLGVPLAGDLWLEESTKEELLGKWLRIVRRERLDVVEGARVTSVARDAGSFVVEATTSSGPVEVRARKVVLALGRRGSPRKLDVPVPDDLLDRVHYSLADARSFVGQSVVVVGLGDVAMETAIALAGQPETQVTLVHRGQGFTRGRARNVAEVQRLAASGRVRLVFGAEVRDLAGGEVGLRAAVSGVPTAAAPPPSVPAEAVFVMIGSIPPRRLLESLGILTPQTP